MTLLLSNVHQEDTFNKHAASQARVAKVRDDRQISVGIIVIIVIRGSYNWKV